MMTPAKFTMALVAGLAMLGLLGAYLLLRDDNIRTETPISTADEGGRTAAAQPEEEPAVPGAGAADARLSGPTDCVKGPFRVRVEGSEISRVSFFVDGKRRRTAEASGPGEGEFSMRIDPREQSERVHRVRADAEFTENSGAGPETMSLIYQRCPRTAATVRFTG